MVSFRINAASRPNTGRDTRASSSSSIGLGEQDPWFTSGPRTDAEHTGAEAIQGSSSLNFIEEQDSSARNPASNTEEVTQRPDEEDGEGEGDEEEEEEDEEEEEEEDSMLSPHVVAEQLRTSPRGAISALPLVVCSPRPTANGQYVFAALAPQSMQRSLVREFEKNFFFGALSGAFFNVLSMVFYLFRPYESFHIGLVFGAAVNDYVCGLIIFCLIKNRGGALFYLYIVELIVASLFAMKGLWFSLISVRKRYVALNEINEHIHSITNGEYISMAAGYRA